MDRPHNSSMSEKVKFYNPNREFEKCLIKTGAKMLPLTKDKKERSDSPPAKKQKSSSLIPSKDMSKQASLAQPHSQTTNHSQSASSHHHTSSQHHHQSKSSQPNHSHSHSHSYHSHSNSSSSSSNNVSNSLLQNHTSHQNHSTANNNHHHHHINHHQSSLPKPKSSKEFIDVFGAPIVYNNTKGQQQNKPAESQRPVKQVESQKPVKQAESQKLMKSAESQKSVKSAESQKPVKSAESQKLVKSADQQKQVNATEQQKQVKPVVPQKQIKPIEARKPPSQPPVAQQSPATASAQTTLPSQTDTLQVIQTKISSLSDCDRLQKIVDIIEESGEWYNLTPNKFEFDLKRIDKKTLNRIEKCLQP